ncbi:MAG: SDR family NAD(P)-dependent oxidoreductase [Gammaproteobacteria bacterium]
MSAKSKQTVQSRRSSNTEPLAIIGIGCMFPKAGSVAGYWSNIKEGVDAITEVPATHWNPGDYFDPDQTTPDMTYARRGGFIDPVDFDPLLYGMSPNNIEATDTTQLLGMVAAREALLDAGYATGRDSHDGRPFDRDRTSVILGVTGTLELVIPLGARLGHPIWRRALADAGVEEALAEEVVQRIADSYVPWQENSFPGLLGNVAAGRIANRFDLGGTNCVIDAACASSLSAIHLAALELQSGRSDMAITGGMDTFNDIFMYMCFSKTPALSVTGHSRPFHADGDGTILGEGLGAIILKRLSDAERDGDRIYALIKGIGSSSDGKGNAIYAPSSAGQKKALHNAYYEADVRPRTIELVEAHGTGTRVGDAVEAESLSAVYREDQPQGSWCALGSVKSMVGHTKAAAGVAGLIKVALALQHKVLPPTIKVDEPLPLLQPGSAPVYINTIKRPWVRTPEHPRRAAVSAFGFGGSNFHAVLEEAAPESNIDWDGNVIMLALSGARTDDINRELGTLSTDLPWHDLRKTAAQSLRVYEPEHPCRLVLVVDRNHTDLNALIKGASAMLANQAGSASWETPEGAYFGGGRAGGKLAFLFPGQGSQYPGMFRDLACQFPQMLSVLETANNSMGENGQGQRLSDRIYPIPVFDAAALAKDKEGLQATASAQPAIAAVSAGAAMILQHFNVTADAAAGHSFGELTALMYAGWYDAETLFQLAKRRGELMQQGEGDRGAMLAAIATPDELYAVIEAQQLDLIIANHNAPSQVVLSGPGDSITRAESILSGQGMQTHRLPVSAAFHSSFVADAEKPFAECINGFTFTPGKIPVYSNTTGETYPGDEREARALLARQLANPVQFVNEIENMYEAGIRTFIEAGPSNIITGLVHSILADRPHTAIAVDASKGQRSGQYDLAVLLAHLSTLGHGCALSHWDAGYLDTLREEKKPAMTIRLCGANYVMPREKKAPVPKKSVDTTPARPSPPTAKTQTTMAQQPGVNVQPPAQVSEALRATQQGILALQKMQEQTAQLHKQYLQGQEQAQHTIHQLVRQQQQLITGMPARVMPAPISASVALDQAPGASHVPEKRPVERRPMPPEPVETEASPTTATEKQTAADNTNQYKNILLEVVAEKTGYPMEMLSLDMSMDTDLGIDSIKRVEILSALQERLPGMQQIQPEELGTFKLLQHIVEFLTADNAAEAAQTDKTPTPEATDASPLFQEILLEVIAEKTGYPVEMLNLDMNLDTDLGIDSIKRVEILSALQERLPNAPAVKAEELAALQTLQQIVEHMQGSHSTPIEVTQTSVTTSASQPDTNIYRSIVEATPLSSTERDAITLDSHKQIWITDDGSGLPEKICRAFEKQQLKARKVAVDARVDASVSALILLAPLDAGDNFVNTAFKTIQRAENMALLASVTRLGGKFGIEGLSSANPVAGAMAGLIKTAAREWPEVNCKALDIPANGSSAKLAATIVEELLLQGPVETGITGQGRVMLALHTVPLHERATSENPFTEGDVVVISGGARGVTAEVAVALANSYHTRLLLLGRSPVPEQEAEWLSGLTDEATIKQAIIARNTQQKPAEIERTCREILARREVVHNLERIKESGVEVCYRSVDVRDRDAVTRAIHHAREHLGPIAGILHGAGVLADRLIVDKTPAQFQQVFSTKVDGLRALLQATEQDPLKAIIMFSSSSARFGRKGQADYAAANEALNKIAQQQQTQRPDCRVLSINWGPWDGGMVTAPLKRIFKSEGVGLIPFKAGSRYLMQEIAAEGPVEVVVTASPLEQETTPVAEDSHIGGALHTAFIRNLNIEDFPLLRAHVINGNAVLPTALIIEWLAHGAMHNNPGSSFIGFDDLRILKGVVLQAGEGRDIEIMAGEAVINGHEDRVPVELRSGKTLHATAQIVLATGYPETKKPDAVIVAGDYPFKNGEYYTNGQLFHGPDLHAIETIDGCSEEGITGHVRLAPPPSRWMARPIRSSWIADPMLLDGCFQMMILWSFHHSGIGSLPAAIGSYRQYQRGFPEGGAQVIARIEKTTPHSSIATIEFIDKDGNLLARMENYECVADASLNEAFNRNKLDLHTEF